MQYFWHNTIRLGVKVIIYEPTISISEFEKYQVCNDLAAFKKNCDVILANRISPDLEDCRSKVYTRDLFSRD